MNKGAVLITEPVHDSLPEGLIQLGFDVVHLPEIQRAEVLKIIADFEGLIINSKIVANRELIEKGQRLKFIARCGSGKEVLDIPFAASRNITCITSPEGNRQAVAEHTLGMLLSLMNHITTAHQEVIAGQWNREPNRGNELYGKRVAIIGYGNTGESFAKVLAGFNVKVLVHDKYRTGFGEGYVAESSLEQIFEEADVVSLHLPLSSETLHYANDIFFDAFKNPIWFLNTARGANLQTHALIRALESGRVIAAGLDVLENEKTDAFNDEDFIWFNKLRSMKNVLLTPHIAGWTLESKRKIAAVLLEKISSLY